MVADAGAARRGGRDAGVGEVGGEREGEFRHQICVACGGDLEGLTVSSGSMEGRESCTVTTRTSEPFLFTVALSIGNSLTVNRKWPTWLTVLV